MRPFAEDLGYDGAPFEWDISKRAKLRAELDAWYARAYGLTRDELRYILDPSEVFGSQYPSETFRGLKNNDLAKFPVEEGSPENRPYRTAWLVLDAWDRLHRGELEPC
jgi:hypothetical protein